MAPNASRAELYSLLRRDLPDDTASALMQALPPLDMPEIARRSDVESLRTDVESLRTDVESLRTELKGDFHGLEARFFELKGDFLDVRGEVTDLRGTVGELKGEVAELGARVDSQLPKFILANVPLTFGVAGLVLAAVKL